MLYFIDIQIDVPFGCKLNDSALMNEVRLSGTDKSLFNFKRGKVMEE